MTKKLTKEVSQAFADKVQIEKAAADRILKILYDKWLDATMLNRVIWRMENFIVTTEVRNIMNAMKNAQIETLIDEIIVQDQGCSKEVCCSESDEIHFRAFFAEVPTDKTLKAGDIVDIQIMRTGNWSHPMYGKIKVDSSTLSEVQANFNKKTRKIDIAVDENHEDNHKALGWFKEVYKKWKDGLFAKIQLTKKGAELLTEGAYKYFSPEIVFQKKDEETGSVIRNLLIGGAFTNRPFFKAMSPLLASEEVDGVAASRHQNGTPENGSSVLLFNSTDTMLKLINKLTQLGSKTSISKTERDDLQACFNETNKDDITEEMTTAFNEVIALFDEDAGGDGSDDKGTEGDGDGSDAGTGSDGADAGDQGDGDGAGDDAGDGSDAGDQGDKSVEASEKKIKGKEGDSDVTIKASELAGYKKAAADAAKVVTEARKTQTLAKANGMVFSDTNKTGVVLKKNVQEIVDFAMGLSEKSAAKFFSIIEKMKSVDAGEAGHGGNGDKSGQFSEADEEKITYFTEKLGQTREEAIVSLAEFKADAAK